jgi:hypothetical protein
MRKLLLVPLAVLVLAGCTSADVIGQTIEGSGTAGTRTERAAGIHHLGLAAPGTLTIEVGRESDLRIEGDDNIVDRLIVERHGDELEIRTPNRTNLRPNRPLRYRIGVASLDGVDLAGSGRIEAAGVNADAFSVDVAGSGEVVIGGLRASSVDLDIAGSGTATLDGRADAVSVDIAGSGTADVGELDARTANVSVAGSGDTTLRVSDRLDVDIMGSGDVSYYGDPTVHRSVMGSGHIARAGD